jgi:hypothetical protein
MSSPPEGACAPRNRRRVAPHLRWEELRWPSFTLWRWAGPALAGWIRYQWRTRRPPPPPRRPHPMGPLRSQRRAAGPAHPNPAGNRPRSRVRRALRRQQGRREDRQSVRLARPLERVARLLVGPVGQSSGWFAKGPGRSARLLARPVGQPSVRLARAPARAASRAADRSVSRNSVLAVGLQTGQGRGTIDQRDVREGLGEIAQELTRQRIDLLGIQADVIRVP